MFDRFGLTLMVTHACNLRCTYCYAGEKREVTMQESVGHAAIERAVRSLRPGGTLDLGFFGGEPLLAEKKVNSFVEHARRECRQNNVTLNLHLTTNGTIDTPQAWSIMLLPEMALAVSYDGIPEAHDRHRRTAAGRGTATQVQATLQKLLQSGRPFSVVMVVRPDTTDWLAAGIDYLQGLGINRIEPSLDIWATWTRPDVARLERAIHDAADLWCEGLPNLSISWFDEKAALLAGASIESGTRCGFGVADLAVAPSGRLYPCERLIGNDDPDNAMSLPGHALDGREDFLPVGPEATRRPTACGNCSALSLCNTFCRCSNYVRTGDIDKPDYLLCAWNQACLEATARAMASLSLIPAAKEPLS